MKPQLLSGARGQVKIGTKVLAYVTDVSIDYQADVRPVHTFGNIAARSVEPLRAGPVNVTLGRVIPVNNGAGAAVNTSMINEGIEPVILQMMAADDIEITLEDKITGATVACVKNCRFAGRSLSMSASQLAQERIQLMGIFDAGQTVGGASQNAPTKLGF